MEPYKYTWVKKTPLIGLTDCSSSTSVASALADVAVEEGILKKGLKENEVTVPSGIRGSNKGKIGHLITCQGKKVLLTFFSPAMMQNKQQLFLILLFFF